MSPQNEALIRDAKALVRESRHVKRAAGWADITAQLAAALERSEEIRESLEAKLQELASDLADRVPGDSNDGETHFVQAS